MDKMITIERYQDEFEAELARTLLEDSGIQAEIQNERIISMIPGLASGRLNLELMVWESDAPAAREILAAAAKDSDPTEILKAEGAILEGHFRLTSGLHSSRYIEKIRVLQNPASAKLLCDKMSSLAAPYSPDAVVGPAYGGIALAFEIASLLGTSFFFTQRVDGKMSVRGGFDLNAIREVVIVEDIVTTGGSVLEVIECLRERGIEVSAVVALVDRSAGKADFGVPFHSLLSMAIPVFDPQDCQLCRDGVPLTKPGSSDKPGN